MIYLLIGATCSGKDKVKNYILEKHKPIEEIVSTTSRPIREGEVEGLDYYFISYDEAKKKLDNGEFVEHRIYNTSVGGKEETWIYGIDKKHIPSLEKDYVAIIDYYGAEELKNYFGEEGKDKIKIVYIQSIYEERYARNVLRGDFDLSEWKRRNKDDSEWLAKAYKACDYRIMNFGVGDNSPENTTDYSFGEIDYNIESLNQSIHPKTFKDTAFLVDTMFSIERNKKTYL